MVMTQAIRSAGASKVSRMAGSATLMMARLSTTISCGSIKAISICRLLAVRLGIVDGFSRYIWTQMGTDCRRW